MRYEQAFRYGGEGGDRDGNTWTLIERMKEWKKESRKILNMKEI